MAIREEWERTALVLGEEAVARLAERRVAVFGVGGVGGFVCEALARAGVGALDLFDYDVVSLSNINRQIVALRSTVGRPKVDVMRERILDINPSCAVTVHPIRYLPENADDHPLSVYDCIVDAVDCVSAKIELAVRATAAGVPLISSMGTGNKTDPSRLILTDLSKTSVCPLAKVMRRELRARGITHLTVLSSTEPPAVAAHNPVGSLPYVPSVAGLTIAGEVVRRLIG